MKIYISGPITGTEDYMNRFSDAENDLNMKRHIAFNPAKISSMMPRETTYEEYMKISFCLLELSDGIFMMKGWETSNGARRELHYAQALGKKIFFEDLGRVDIK